MELLSETGILPFLLLHLFLYQFVYYQLDILFLNLLEIKKVYLMTLKFAIKFSNYKFMAIFSKWEFFNNWMGIVYYFPIGLLIWQRVKSKELLKIK